MPFLTAAEAYAKALETRKANEPFYREKCQDLALKLEVEIDLAIEKGKFEALLPVSVKEVELLRDYLKEFIFDELLAKKYEVTFFQYKVDYEGAGYTSPTIRVLFSSIPIVTPTPEPTPTPPSLPVTVEAESPLLSAEEAHQQAHKTRIGQCQKLLSAINREIADATADGKVEAFTLITNTQIEQLREYLQAHVFDHIRKKGYDVTLISEEEAYRAGWFYPVIRVKF